MIKKRLLKARHWSSQASRLGRENYCDSEAERKSDNSVVTETDRDIERYLRKKITQQFPQDSIIGEEMANRFDESNSFCWYLDPIDGTAAFSLELPIWSISIGLWTEQKPCFGILRAPVLNEEYYCSKNSPVFKNGDVLDSSYTPEREWDSQTLLCIPSKTHRTYDIDFPGKARSLGSTAYHMAMVLDGRAVGVLVPSNIHMWDMAAVLAMAKPLGIGIKKIDGTDLRWDQLMAGQRPDKSLIFSHDETVDELVDRVSMKS